MIRAFIDSSVFFSACLSAQGASREILLERLRGTVLPVLSDLVLEETERNLVALPRRAAEAVAAFHLLVSAVPFQVTNPTVQEVLAVAQYVVLKDAPIVAAALTAHVDHLVSLDRRHLVGVREVSRRSGLSIVLPEELLRYLRLP